MDDASSFDHVFSSFMLHHLTATEQEATLREVRRVLRPRAAVHLLDFVAPHRANGSGRHQLSHRSGSRPRRGHEELACLLRSAGFEEVLEVSRHSLLYQSVVYLRAVAPA